MNENEIQPVEALKECPGLSDLPVSKEFSPSEARRTWEFFTSLCRGSGLTDPIGFSAEKSKPLDGMRNRTLNLGNPALIYALFWGGGISLSFIKSAFSFQTNWMIVSAVLFSILSFFVWDWIFNRFAKGAGTVPSSIDHTPGTRELYVLAEFTQKILILWLVGYAINVVASGGSPIIWRMRGIPKSYADFGLPSFTGMLNALRLFLVSSMMLLLPILGVRRAVILGALLFGSCFAELSRGAATIVLGTAAGTFLTMHPIPIKKLYRLLLALPLFILTFGLITRLRGGHFDVAPFVAPDSIFLKLPGSVFWIFCYWTSPIQNLYYGYGATTTTFIPNFTLQPLVPTIIRESLTVWGYPFPLLTEALNATSCWGPLIADFGLGISVLIICYSQFGLAYVYQRARAGEPAYVMMNGGIFAALALSVFFNYFLSLIFIFYVLLVVTYSLYRNGRLEAITQFA